MVDNKSPLVIAYCPLLALTITFTNRGFVKYAGNIREHFWIHDSFSEWFEQISTKISSGCLEVRANGCLSAFPSFGEGVSVATTLGIRVTMSCYFLPILSSSHHKRYAFAYQIT